MNSTTVRCTWLMSLNMLNLLKSIWFLMGEIYKPKEWLFNGGISCLSDQRENLFLVRGS